jgi:hypothetical protein
LWLSNKGKLTAGPVTFPVEFTEEACAALLQIAGDEVVSAWVPDALVLLGLAIIERRTRRAAAGADETHSEPRSGISESPPFRFCSAPLASPTTPAGGVHDSGEHAPGVNARTAGLYCAPIKRT